MTAALVADAHRRVGLCGARPPVRRIALAGELHRPQPGPSLAMVVTEVTDAYVIGTSQQYEAAAASCRRVTQPATIKIKNWSAGQRVAVTVHALARVPEPPGRRGARYDASAT